MLILLQGRLGVLGKGDAPLGDIHPGTSCGEMGLFTGHTRSATILAAAKSAGFVIRKQDLDGILDSDLSTKVKILQNVVELLTSRLVGADVQIEGFAAKPQKPEDDIESLAQTDAPEDTEGAAQE